MVMKAKENQAEASQQAGEEKPSEDKMQPVSLNVGDQDIRKIQMISFSTSLRKEQVT